MVQFLTHPSVAPAPPFRLDESGEAVIGLPTLPLFLGELFWRPGEPLVTVPTPLGELAVPPALVLGSPVGSPLTRRLCLPHTRHVAICSATRFFFPLT